MPEYRRLHHPGACLFLTLVTYHRRPLFTSPDRIQLLRQSLRVVKSEMPFTIDAAVILPDHIHLLCTLPDGDNRYSARIGRLKILFTRSLHVGWAPPTTLSPSRQKHRESDIWQRRFWEHTIRDQEDFNRHLNYIHYNPVKHQLTPCPHAWPYSSFLHWVRKAAYDKDWCCSCDAPSKPPNFTDIEQTCGE